ncbi:DUF397 domain-containing protein [Streptomyces yaizuensis]|uniref:DUF397 domain-containing protein n=1 Tax=Streptomyces yaizuensis TaxID=2989713 RepID=UPI002B202164|nr:DUF397 domain-containing protein [Streptomyces sp. YSPA8]
MTTNSSSLRWLKSIYSNGNGNCVEWAPAHVATTGTVPVRDSKWADGPVLMVSADAFAGLVTMARSADL